MTKAKYTFGKVSLQGMRDYNEDTIDIICGNKFNYFGLYDGHGGKFVSQYLKSNLGKTLESSKTISKNGIKKVYKNLQDTLKGKHLEKSLEIGSTAISFINMGKKNYIVNLGDCRAIVVKNNKIIFETLDHKPHKSYESERIKKLGGKITREKDDCTRIDGLAVSRCFGDVSSEPFIIQVPDITEIKDDFDYILIACDGLWDEMTSKQVANFIEKNSKKNESNNKLVKKLANHAINVMGSTDNVSIIIIQK